MKKIEIILIICLVIVAVVAGAGWYQVYDLSGKLQVSYNDNQLLQDENKQLSDNNTKLLTSVNLKSFVNEKELERFLKDDDTDVKYSTSHYASEACINLMRNARDKGYWMGILPCNTSEANLISATVSYQLGLSDSKWDIYALTIVGDDTLYLIDPLSDTSYMRVMKIGADFKYYCMPQEIKSPQVN